jgi:hypothetical protein
MYNALVAGFYGPATTTSIILQTSLYTVGVSFQPMATKKRAAKPKGIVDDIKNAAGNALSGIPGIDQNIKYFKAAQKGPKAVLKAAAVDAAWSATGAAIGQAGSKVGKIVGKAAGKTVGALVSDSYFDAATSNLNKINQGGKVFRTNTPMGPSLGSTKIMTPGQRSAAQAGLSQIASNQADRAGAITANEVNALMSGAIRATSRGIGAATAGAGVSANKPKSKPKPKARKNVR